MVPEAGKFWRRCAEDASPGDAAFMLCVCGSTPTYVGLNVVECSTEGCANYARSALEPEHSHLLPLLVQEFQLCPCADVSFAAMRQRVERWLPRVADCTGRTYAYRLCAGRQPPQQAIEIYEADKPHLAVYLYQKGDRWCVAAQL